MKSISRISLYLLGLLALLSFFSPSYPAWSFARAVPWGLCLTGAAAILAWEWRRAPIWTRIPGREWKMPCLHLLAIIAGIILIHLFLLTNRYANLNSDAEMSVIAARAIVQDGARPVYIFNQFYQGVLISYFYALFLPLTGDLHLAVYIVNLIFLSLGIFFLSRVFRKITGTSFYWVLLAMSLLEIMRFISTETIHGGALIFCLLAIIVHELHALLFSDRNRFFILGIACGLLFFQYQQALPLLVIIFLAVLISQIRRGVVSAAGILTAGFIMGSFPHLLAELYDNFLNTDAMFLCKSGSLLKNVLDWKNMTRHFIFHPLRIESGVLSKAFFPLFLAGFGLSLYLALKKNKKDFFLLPSLYLLIVLITTGTGLSPDNFRFNFHFLIFTPLALLLAAVPFSVSPFWKWKTVRTIFVIVFLLGNGYRSVDCWRTYHRRHISNLRIIQMLDRSPAQIIFGEYWFTKRFQACVGPEKTILSSSSLLLPQVYRSPGQPPFAYIKASRFWTKAEKGYLARSLNSAKSLKQLLGSLGIRHDIVRIGHSSLFFHFKPDPPIELFHSLSLAELASEWKDKAIVSIHRTLPRIESIRQDGNRLIVRSTPGDSMNEVFPDWRMRIEQNGLAVEIPLVFRNGRLECLIPEGIAVPTGECVLTFTWKHISLHRQKIVLEGTSNRSSSFLQFGLSDRQRFFFHMKNEKNLMNPADDFGLEFKRLAPSERLFSGTAHEVRGWGAPLQDQTVVRIVNPRVRQIKIAMISLLDFDSLAWSIRFSQTLHISGKTGRQSDLLPVHPGFNEIRVAVKEGDNLRFQSTWSSYFTAEDSVGNMSLPQSGVLLLRFTCLDASGRILAEISPHLTIAGIGNEVIRPELGTVKTTTD